MRRAIASFNFGAALRDLLDKPSIKINLYLKLQQPKWPFLDKS
jgi:hypothetical protein